MNSTPIFCCQGFALLPESAEICYNGRVQAKENYLMPAVMEAIDRMSPDERVKTMEYLWAAMTAAAEPEPPAWHGDILDERRRRVAAGEEKFIPLEEAMRQLREEVACR